MNYWWIGTQGSERYSMESNALPILHIHQVCIINNDKCKQTTKRNEKKLLFLFSSCFFKIVAVSLRVVAHVGSTRRSRSWYAESRRWLFSVFRLLIFGRFPFTLALLVHNTISLCINFLALLFDDKIPFPQHENKKLSGTHNHNSTKLTMMFVLVNFKCGWIESKRMFNNLIIGAIAMCNGYNFVFVRYSKNGIEDDTYY